MVKEHLDTLLDRCIERMNGGESLESCLASYPDDAADLEPLLRAIVDIRDTCSAIPVPSARSLARSRFNAALAARSSRSRKLPSFGRPWFGWRRGWGLATAVLVLAIICASIAYVLIPGETLRVDAQDKNEGRIAGP